MADTRPSTDWSCDVMDADCPARALLGALGEKWTLLVLRALGEGLYRPSAIRRRIGGISEKMLRQSLRNLEQLGFVSREDQQSSPPEVHYTLTELGRSLDPVIRSFSVWIEANAPRVFPPDGAQRRLPLPL